MIKQALHQSKHKLLDAAMYTIRAKGFAATTVEDICEAAGVTKGSFFHHFKSKEDLALATIDHFSEMAADIFAQAPYRLAQDPLERLLGYVEFRAAILEGDIPEYTCLLGTMIQEIYNTHPALLTACDRAMSAHIAELAEDVEAARRLYAPTADWSAESVGYFIQSVLQGALILAKSKQDSEVARKSLYHLRHYLNSLFTQPKELL